MVTGLAIYKENRGPFLQMARNDHWAAPTGPSLEALTETTPLTVTTLILVAGSFCPIAAVGAAAVISDELNHTFRKGIIVKRPIS
jgi:hypothetical protein